MTRDAELSPEYLADFAKAIGVPKLEAWQVDHLQELHRAMVEDRPVFSLYAPQEPEDEPVSQSGVRVVLDPQTGAQGRTEEN